MYGIFTYIYHKNQPNVGKYTIQGSYGLYDLILYSNIQYLHHLPPSFIQASGPWVILGGATAIPISFFTNTTPGFKKGIKRLGMLRKGQPQKHYKPSYHPAASLWYHHFVPDLTHLSDKRRASRGAKQLCQLDIPISTAIFGSLHHKLDVNKFKIQDVQAHIPYNASVDGQNWWNCTSNSVLSPCDCCVCLECPQSMISLTPQAGANGATCARLNTLKEFLNDLNYIMYSKWL